MSKQQITVTAIKAFNDNYIWALTNSTSNTTALVDPGDANVCIEYLENSNQILSAILITHHHPDHVGGIKALLEYANKNAWSVTVYGPATEKIENLDVTLKENDSVNLAELNYQLKVLDLPGHTKGHIAYVNEDILFCGDTLFSGGCGRLFEGTPEQMHESLTKLANLPEQTLVYCAHEYTQANLSFALAVEPSNSQLQEYATNVQTLRAKNQASIPTSIALEKQINPFLRCNKSAIKLAAQEYAKQEFNKESDIFGAIRAWKDNF